MKRICEINGCDRKYKARDLCAMHYERWMRDPNHKERPLLPPGHPVVPPIYPFCRCDGPLRSSIFFGAAVLCRICSLLVRGEGKDVVIVIGEGVAV